MGAEGIIVSPRRVQHSQRGRVGADFAMVLWRSSSAAGRLCGVHQDHGFHGWMPMQSVARAGLHRSRMRSEMPVLSGSKAAFFRAIRCREACIVCWRAAKGIDFARLTSAGCFYSLIPKNYRCV
jgi:hypothetical protein